MCICVLYIDTNSMFEIVFEKVLPNALIFIEVAPSHFPIQFLHLAASIALDIREVLIVNFHLNKNPFRQDNSNTFAFRKRATFFIRYELSVFEFQLTDNVTIVGSRLLYGHLVFGEIFKEVGW